MTQQLTRTDLPPEKPNWLFCSVTYQPGSDFFLRLRQLLDAGYQAMVFENSPQLSREFQTFEGMSNLTVLHQQQNIGLGKALHLLMQEAYKTGTEFALYFDQDTLFSLQSLNWIDHWLMSHKTQAADFAAIQFTSEKQDGKTINPQRLLINSASLFQLEKLRQLGWHDETFFLEGVDYKFCLDSAFHAFALGRVAGCPDIDHETPQPLQKRSLLGKDISFRLYPRHRQQAFLKVLLRLAVISLRRGQYRYVYIFLRNFATHSLTQLGFLWLSILPKTSKK